jgi:hypothetical protein
MRTLLVPERSGDEPMRRISVVPGALLRFLLQLTLLGLASRAAAAGFDETHRIWTVHGAPPGAAFGAAVARAGDVNGDGFPDVIVGAPLYDGAAGSHSGKAFVYYGAASGLASTPGWQVEGEEEGSQFGFAVAAAGDVNGDGFADVIVGAPYLDIPDQHRSDAGRVYVYLGSAQGLSTSASFTASGFGRDLGHVGGLGYAVSSGDFDGDGFSDVVASEVGRDRGQVVVFYGSASGPSNGRVWRSSGGNFSGRTAAADLNGDGYDDLFVSAYAFDLGLESHAASVRLGSARGLPRPTRPPALAFPAVYAATPVGDVDGDGRLDVLTIEYSTMFVDVFAAHLLYRRGFGPKSGDRLGSVFDVASLVLPAGDLNGDGFADAIALDGSLFYAYFGSSTGFSPLSDGMGPAPGTTLAALPDVNGDGISDLIVGDAAHDRVDVYRGGNDWSFAATADVSVEKTLCLDCNPGPIGVTVSNAGPDPVRVRLVDLEPPSLIGFGWFCLSPSGAASIGCVVPPGPVFPYAGGDIDVVITIRPGGSIEYRAFLFDALEPAVNTASLVLPPWVTDPDPGNNHAVAVSAPPPTELIFFDRFDSGDLSAWSSNSASGVEAVTSPANDADFLLRATASDSAPAVVRDETPAGEPDYHARFVLDPADFGRSKGPGPETPRDATAVVLSGRGDTSPAALFELRLESGSGGLFLRGRVRRDDGAVRQTALLSFTRAPHVVEVSWHRSSGPGANNGKLVIHLGEEETGVCALDNDAMGGIDSVALGLEMVDGHRSPRVDRTVFLDDFESWRLRPGPRAPVPRALAGDVCETPRP